MAIIIGSTSAGTLGTVTLSDIKSIIQAHGYGTDTTAIQTTAVRAALRELYGQRRWNFLRQSITTFSATVANNGIVDLSTVGRGIILDTVRISFGADYRDMRYVNQPELERARFTDPTPGFPARWTRRMDSVLVYPIPDQTYPLEIVAQALTTLPSSDGDSIFWPETHIMVIVWNAIMLLTWRQRDYNGHDRAKQEFADALVRLMRDEELVEEQTDLEVGHWDGWRRGGVGLP